MPRYERLGRALPADILDKVKLRRDKDGKLEIDAPQRPTQETTEVAEKPPQPGDPRSATARNVPPYGGA